MRFEPVPALRPGAHVRVLAPASPFPEEPFARGLAALRERYHVSLGASLRARDAYLAGPDAARLADLSAALADPEVDAIVAARGGYGVTRLLPSLEVAAIARRPRLLVGFSDLTALHAAWARAGLRSVHASMVTGLGRGGEAERAAWVAACEGAPPGPIEGRGAIRGGVAEGPLVGGNLAVLCALLGTPFAPPLDGAIVLLEDVGEAPYRVDRMLTQLRQAGLRRARGVALGEFTACAARDDGREVPHVLADRLGDLGIPVLAGLPVGHGADNAPLPLGAPCRLDADRGALLPLEPATLTV